LATHDIGEGSNCNQPLFRHGLGLAWIDIAVGLLIAGVLAAWVSNSFWQAFFLQGHPILAKL
jgi:hypothetical protein